MKGEKKEATMKAMARKEEVIRKKKRNVHAALCACVLKITVRELSDQN